MNASLLASIGCLLACCCFGQGTVLFANKVTGSVDARVIGRKVTFPFDEPVDDRFVAQLFAAPPGAPLAAVGEPVPFYRSPDIARGYFPPSVRTIPGVVPGGPVSVKVVAWYRGLGDTYGEVQARGQGGFGESSVITVLSSHGGINPPKLLTGLQGFRIALTLGFDPTPYPIVPSGFPPHAKGIRQSFDFFPTLEWVMGIDATATTAFVASGFGGLRTFDLRDPGGPSLLGYQSLDHTMARAIAVNGNFAYLAMSDWGGLGSAGGLRIVEVTNPAEPRPFSRVDLAGEPQTIALSTDGHWAWICAGQSGLHVVDVRDPAAPKVVGHYVPGGYALGFALKGEVGYLAATDAGLHVLDLTDPANPRKIGVYAAGDSLVHVALRDSHAFVSGRESGLHVVDVSDPSQPRRIGLASMVGGAGPSIIVGRHIYVQNNWGSLTQPGGFSVVDISRAESPQVVGRTQVAKQATDFAISGGNLWVADYVGLTSFPLGPVLGISPDRSFHILGVRGQPYEIQASDPTEGFPVWSRLSEITSTGEFQPLDLPVNPASTGRMIRAVALP